MDNFDEFIESTKQKKYINYFDFVHIINACNVHYYENKYDEVHFSGIHPQKKRKPIQNLPSASSYDFFTQNNVGQINHNYQYPIRLDQNHPNASDPLYNNINLYSGLGCAAASNQDIDMPHSGLRSRIEVNEYSILPKPEHLTRYSVIAASEKCPENKIDKIKKQIDFTVNTLDDLLKLIEQHPYLEEYEYNIDLKGLHAIEPELKQLNGMIGIKSLKNSVLNQLIYFIQQPLLGNTNDFKHTIICGPPGTGKTEIAKILGQMYCKIGVLKTNIFKKVTRNDLVAGYLGQTAIKTKDVINSCIGGCLFLDEAYSLGGGDNTDSFAKECVDILCEALSDHKEDLMVIVAGYEDDLKNHFFSINKGLESRFIWKFNIDDYSSKDMVEIFEKKVRELEWQLNGELSNKKLVEWIDSKKENFKHFGRDIEILLSHCKICHSRRVYGKSSDLLKKITLEDLETGYKYFLENGKKKPHERYCSLYL